MQCLLSGHLVCVHKEGKGILIGTDLSRNFEFSGLGTLLISFTQPPGSFCARPCQPLLGEGPWNTILSIGLISASLLLCIPEARHPLGSAGSTTQKFVPRKHLKTHAAGAAEKSAFGSPESASRYCARRCWKNSRSRDLQLQPTLNPHISISIHISFSVNISISININISISISINISSEAKARPGLAPEGSLWCLLSLSLSLSLSLPHASHQIPPATQARRSCARLYA